MSGPSRRTLLRGAVAGVLASLAGCGAGGDGQSTYVTTTKPTDAVPTYEGSLSVEGDVRTYRFDRHRSGVTDDAGPTASPRLAWTYGTDAQFDSSPAVVDGTVYLGGGDGDLHAVDAATGSGTWTTDVTAEQRERVDTSPAVAGDAVVAGSGRYKNGQPGHVVAVGRGGTERWRTPVGDNTLSAPLVRDDAVFAGSTAGLHRLSLADGSETWRLDTAAASDAVERGENPVDSGVTLAPSVGDAGALVVGTRAGTVFAVDPASGDVRWQFQTDGEVDATPAVVGAPGGTEGSSESSDGGTVYAGSYDGNLYALSAADGSERWRYETDGFVSAAPAVDGDGAYFTSEAGTLAAVETADGSERWTVEVAERTDCAPVVAAGVVYVGTADRRLLAVDAESGETLWTARIGGNVQSAPTVVDGVLFVAARDGNCYAFTDAA
jgi:outer membrane protein assembly factor BamB